MRIFTPKKQLKRIVPDWEAKCQWWDKSLKNAEQEGTIQGNPLISQMRKLRLWEVKQFVQGHHVRKCLRQNLNPDLPDFHSPVLWLSPHLEFSGYHTIEKWFFFLKFHLWSQVASLHTRSHPCTMTLIHISFSSQPRRKGWAPLYKAQDTKQGLNPQRRCLIWSLKNRYPLRKFWCELHSSLLTNFFFKWI